MARDNDRESAREMEQIQKGLEAFLRQEMKEMEENPNHSVQDRELQLFDMSDEEDDDEDIRVIPVSKSTSGARRKRVIREEDYVEDWDSEEHRERVKKAKASGKQVTERKSRRCEEPEEPEEEPIKTKQKTTKKKTKKKKSKFKKFLFFLLLLAVVFFGGMYYVVGAVYGKMKYEAIDSVKSAPMKEDGVVNILLIGNDSRENGEDGRSDAMILLSISNETKKIYMTSLLRDMYVEIPGHDGNRLNAAYSFGGPELLMETIEKNFDISVNRYMLVNFEAFANLVDAVGGVDLELTTGEVEYVNGYLVEYNMLLDRPQGTDNLDTSVSGLIHLNGAQALAYSRNRYIGTDFGRTERQRKVLTEVIHNLPKAVIGNPQKLVDGLMPNLTTNLTQNECYRLGLMGGKALTYDIISSSLPIEGTYHDAKIRGMAVLEVDFEANKQFFRDN
ncbi:MAG: LCP family protein, partial [Acetatifactor sp.]|nr:LCP family protein [Acetatifactor sp.]